MFTAQREGRVGARDSIDEGSVMGALALYSVPVPEPTSAWLLPGGVAALAGMGWRRGSVFTTRRSP